MAVAYQHFVIPAGERDRQEREAIKACPTRTRIAERPLLLWGRSFPLPLLRQGLPVVILSEAA